MKSKFLIIMLTGLALTGCSNFLDPLTPSKPEVVKKTHQKPTAEKLEAYHQIMIKVALSTKDDSQYNRMALDTPEKKAWFKDLMYRLWDKQITKNQFINEGLKKYPTHQYEFNFIAKKFQQYL